MSRTLGHASLKVTEAYLSSFDEKVVDDTLDNMCKMSCAFNLDKLCFMENDAVNQLFNEFSNISVEIIIGDKQFYPFDDVEDPLVNQLFKDDDYIIEGHTYWEFDFIFQKEFKISYCDFNNIYSAPQDYLEHLKKLKLTFYLQISEEIRKELSVFKTLIILSDYRTRFKELLSHYGEDHSYENSYSMIYKTNDFVRCTKDKDKSILYHFYIQKLSSFLSSQIYILEEIITFLDEKIVIVERFRPSEPKQLDERLKTDKSLKINSKDKSFELVNRGLVDKPCFNQFVVGLVDSKFIDESEKNKIKHVFTGSQMKQPVVWRGDQGALKYLIQQLRKKGIIRKPKAFWSTTSVYFKFKDEEIMPKNISTLKIPTKDSTITKLESLISLLKNGNDEITANLDKRKPNRIRKI